MNHINVFVEAAGDTIPPRELPLAGDAELKLVLDRVQEADDLYHDDSGNLLVDRDWYEACTLDFGDWLQCHIPNLDAHMLAYKYADDYAVIKSWLQFVAGEAADSLREQLVEKYGLPGRAEVAQAQVIASSIISLSMPITVSVLCEGADLDRFYFPAFPKGSDPDFLMDLAGGVLDEMELDLSEEERRSQTYLRLLMALLVSCIQSRSGAFTYVVHDDDDNTEIVDIHVFAGGHLCAVDPDDLSEVMNIITEDPSILMDIVMSYDPNTDYEAVMLACASAIAGGLHEGLEIAYEHTCKVPVGDEMEGQELSVGLATSMPLIMEKALTGEFAGQVGPIPDLLDPAAKVFRDAMEVSPFVTPEEATRFMLSAEIARGAMELLLCGTVHGASERAVDLIQQIELGMVDEDILMEDIEVMESHAGYIEQMAELDVTDEAYDALPDESKHSLTHLMNMMTLDGNEMHSIVALEGDLESNGSKITAKCLNMPPITTDIPRDVHDKLYRMLKSLVLDATNSPNTTLFCASKVPMSSEAHLSALGVKNGMWTDLGEEKAMMLLDATNVGEPLNLQPGDTLDYRKLL